MIAVPWNMQTMAWNCLAIHHEVGHDLDRDLEILGEILGEIMKEFSRMVFIQASPDGNATIYEAIMMQMAEIDKLLHRLFTT
jgi:hypothetical protein